MGLIDDIESKIGKIENLNPLEKETFFAMLETVEKSKLTPNKLKDYITSMRESVEQEIVKEYPFKRIFIFKIENPKLVKLQSRLQNYLLLESFLLTPQRAKEQLESMIGNLKK